MRALNRSVRAASTGKDHPPAARLPALLRSDLLARYPDACGWSRVRVILRFLLDPSLQAVLVFRLAARSRGHTVFLWRIWTIAHYRSEVFNCEVGPGLHLPHPFNIVIAQGVTLGSNVTVYHGVTIGTARAPRAGQMLPTPTIGDGVVIGPGSVVAGPIRIGSESHLGPHAFLDRDVAPGSVVTADDAVCGPVVAAGPMDGVPR